MLRAFIAWLKARRQRQFNLGYARGLEEVRQYGKVGAIHRMQADFAFGWGFGPFEQGQLAAIEES